MSADEIIARQLAKAAFGWMSAARHLIGPFLCSFLHRWSSRILRIAVPFQAHPLDVIQSLDMYFSSCMRACSKNTSHPLSVFEALLHQTFFTFSKNSAIWPKFGSFYCALSWMMCQVSGRLLVHCIHRRKAYK